MKNHFYSISIFFNKKFKLKQIFVILFTSSIYAPAYAAVATATATVDITSTIIINTINGVFFGDISPGAAAGTLALSPSGIRTTTGGVTVNTAIAGSPATFDVQGTPNATYSVSLPAAVIMSNVASSIVMDTFTSSPATTGVIGASGQQTLFVGATLNVGSNQSFGTYTGSLSVTVDYN